MRETAREPGGPVDDPDSARQRLAEWAAGALHAADRASRALGITLVAVAPGRASVRMTVTASMLNGHGTVHGGYLFLLADSAFAFACNTGGSATVARAAEIVFVTPANLGDELTATALERVGWGRSGVYDVTVGDQRGRVVAEFRGHSHDLRRPLTGLGPAHLREEQ